MSERDVGPAFPTSDTPNMMTGMSKRDYFAAAALPSIIMVCAQDNRPEGMGRSEYFAVTAYKTADAMLHAKETTPMTNPAVERVADIVEGLRALMAEHPNAKTLWPHRVLHDAADTISALRAENDALRKVLHQGIDLFDTGNEIHISTRYFWCEKARAALFREKAE